MPQELNRLIYNKAFTMALKVRFLNTKEEFKQYVSAIYLAMMWGEKITNRNTSG